MPGDCKRTIRPQGVGVTGNCELSDGDTRN